MILYDVIKISHEKSSTEVDDGKDDVEDDGDTQDLDTKCSSSEELSNLKGMMQLQVLKEEEEEEASVGRNSNVSIVEENHRQFDLQNNLAELTGEGTTLDGIVGHAYAMVGVSANDEGDDSTSNFDKLLEPTDRKQGQQTQMRAMEEDRGGAERGIFWSTETITTKVSDVMNNMIQYFVDLSNTD